MFRNCLVVVFGLLAVGVIADACGSTTVTRTGTADSVEEAAPPEPALSPEERLEAQRAEYVARLDREIDGMGNFSVSEYTGSRDQILLAAVLFSAYAKLAEDGNALSLQGEDAAKLDRFKQRLRQLQRQSFPQLRDAYGPIVRRLMWEHDIEVRTVGSGYRTIQFTGGTFAANRNIQSFQTGVSDVLNQLRFQRAEYRWYQGASRFTSYTLENPTDTDIAIFVGNRLRVIE